MALDTDTLVRLRQQNGWSQAKTARAAGINQSYYSQLEKQRKVAPSPEVVERIAEALGVEPWELVANGEVVA